MSDRYLKTGQEVSVQHQEQGNLDTALSNIEAPSCVLATDPAVSRWTLPVSRGLGCRPDPDPLNGRKEQSKNWRAPHETEQASCHLRVLWLKSLKLLITAATSNANLYLYRRGMGVWDSHKATLILNLSFCWTWLLFHECLTYFL